MNTVKKNFFKEIFYIIVYTVTFIIFKITKIVNWSWILVFSPIWIPILIHIGAFIIGMIKGLKEKDIKK